MSQPLPDLLQVKPLNRPMNQVYTTEILRPVTFSQHGARFIISPNGIWSAESSQLIMRLVVDNVASGLYGYPSSTGACALIKRAYLEIGGRRVSSLNEVGHYLTFRRLHYSPDYKTQVMRPKQSGNDTFFGSGPAALPIQPSALDGGWGSIGRPPNSHTSADVAGLNSVEAKRYLLGPTADVGTTEMLVVDADQLTCEVSINVGQQLIPMLRGLQLPVFAIKEQIALVVEFSQDVVGLDCGGGHRFVRDVDEGTTSTLSTIDQNSFVLASDHLMYPDAMESIAQVVQSPEGYNVTFDEVIDAVVNENGGGVPDVQLNFSHQLGLGGKLVKSIVVQQQSDMGGTGENAYMGQYHSDALSNASTYNFTVDSVPFYAMDIENPSLKYTEVSHVDRVPLQSPMSQYALHPNQTSDTGVRELALSGFTQREYKGSSQATIDGGSQHWTGVDFTNAAGEGRRMTNMPVLLNRSYVPHDSEEDNVLVCRTFTTTQRIAHLKNGLVQIVE
tara:strand:- start:5089 stop:6594 length:1506 start_codon:yes stop_codon:yes gene_type:complete